MRLNNIGLMGWFPGHYVPPAYVRMPATGVSDSPVQGEELFAKTPNG
jgi:hypothetical protein